MPTWIFQASPTYFDIDGYLAKENNISWAVRQKTHAPTIAIGDRVFVWRGNEGAKREGGIVASGTITEAAVEREDDMQAIQYWRDEKGAHELFPRVRVQV